MGAEHRGVDVKVLLEGKDASEAASIDQSMETIDDTVSDPTQARMIRAMKLDQCLFKGCGLSLSQAVMTVPCYR